MAIGALSRRDARAIPAETHEVRAFVVVRDEIHRLPFMLAHHRQLGIGRFFIVDNASTDGTAEYLLAQPDVHVFWTDASYQDARLGIDWLEALLAEFGLDRWCLLIDADEQLVYPDCESWDLGRLCEKLDARGLNCLATMVIDMYAREPLADSRLRPGESLIERCGYFDRSGYHNVVPFTACLPRIYGGVRARLFWPEIDLPRSIDLLARAGTQAFDQAAYRARHPDVAEAIRQGVMESALEHFLAYGWREGREVAVRPLAHWPEAGYLAAHADVRDAVERGLFTSGLEHYVRHGQFDRQLPSPWPPCLSQVALVRWQAGMHYRVGRHRLSGVTWRRRDTVGGILLHFRLMADAIGRARVIPATHPGPAQTWGEENARYYRVLAQQPDLRALADISERYRSAGQLVELGLVCPLDEL